jgi:hypothetical protein
MRMTDRPQCGLPAAATRRALIAALGLIVSALAVAEEGDAIRMSTLHYGIDARVPSLAGDDPAIAKANAALRARVQAIVDDFLADYQELTAAEAGGAPPGQPWSLEIGASPPYRTDELAAIRLSGYEYRGGAHGMPIIETVLIDLSDGRLLTPADLFRSGSDWLPVLSERSREALKDRDLLGPDLEWLNRGTAPDIENYQLLMPGADGLTVIFPPYQVAPYAAGVQEVLVPWTELRGLLNPAFFDD